MNPSLSIFFITTHLKDRESFIKCFSIFLGLQGIQKQGFGAELII